MEKPELFPEELNAAFQRLKDNPAAWHAEQEERALWDCAQPCLLDTHSFSLNAEDFKEFGELLDAPPQNAEGLRRLLTTKTPWDEA